MGQGRSRMGLALSVMLCGACTDPPTVPPDDPPYAAAVVAVEPPTTGFSGEPVELEFVVRDQHDDPFAGQAVAFTAAAGAVEPPQATTDAAGRVAVRWTLADQDVLQRMSAAAGEASVDVAVRTGPRLVELVLEDVPPNMPRGTVASLALRARTSTGRLLPWTSSFSIELIADDPAYPEFPVLGIRPDVIEALGPGTATIRVVAGELVSQPATIIVPRLPILLRAEPAELPPTGGTARVIGYDLDLLEAPVTLDGEPASILSQSATALEVAVPPAPGDCRGRPRLAIGADGAWQPNGALVLYRPVGGALTLDVGVIQRLGASVTQCIRLNGGASAEYVLGFFDTRGIESARNAPEDDRFADQTWTLGVADRSTARAEGQAGFTAPASVVVTQANAGMDVLGPPARATADQSDDYYLKRAVPWAAGDSFSIDVNGLLERGRILEVTGPFAVGTLDRDSAYRIPARLVDTREVLQRFLQYGEPVLREAFIDEWPATTRGSGQTLIIVGAWVNAGFLAVGLGTVDRGVWVAVNPGIAGTAPDLPLYFQEETLFHEMAHAWQDRYAMHRCVTLADCGYDFWYHRWAVEGGAELANEIMLAARYGYQPTGNHPISGNILNVLGTVFGSGAPPHFSFDRGYATSSWFLKDVVQRMLDAGLTRAVALAAAARGSFEGWFGQRADGGPRRPGLQDRVSALTGTAWDPVTAALMGVITLGADDLTGRPDLQVPFLRNAWDYWAPSATFTLGDATTFATSLWGISFAHYRLVDPLGLGGSILIEAAVPGIEWGIVRVR
jgi:hypothetical protein